MGEEGELVELGDHGLSKLGFLASEFVEGEDEGAIGVDDKSLFFCEGGGKLPTGEGEALLEAAALFVDEDKGGKRFTLKAFGFYLYFFEVGAEEAGDVGGL